MSTYNNGLHVAEIMQHLNPCFNACHRVCWKLIKFAVHETLAQLVLWNISS